MFTYILGLLQLVVVVIGGGDVIERGVKVSLKGEQLIAVHNGHWPPAWHNSMLLWCFALLERKRRERERESLVSVISMFEDSGSPSSQAHPFEEAQSP